MATLPAARVVDPVPQPMSTTRSVRDGIMGPELMAEMRVQAERFGAEVIRGHATAVNLGSHPFTVRTSDAEYTSRSLIIATGATARLLGLPSERGLLGHGVSTCATCDGYFFRGRPIAVAVSALPSATCAATATI